MSIGIFEGCQISNKHFCRDVFADGKKVWGLVAACCLPDPRGLQRGNIVLLAVCIPYLTLGLIVLFCLPLSDPIVKATVPTLIRVPQARVPQAGGLRRTDPFKGTLKFLAFGASHRLTLMQISKSGPCLLIWKSRLTLYI